MKTTIRDVAHAAGVSIGTVSRVLNGHAAVSDESRTRVDKVVRSLNYSPLRKRRVPHGGPGLLGKRIAVIGLGMDRSLTSLSVIGEAIHAVEATLSEAGASLELIDLPRLDQVPTTLKQDSLDGLILFGALQGKMIQAAKPALVRRLAALPSVWLQRRPEGCWGDSVGPNDWLVGQLAAEYLINKGHRRLAFLSSRGDHTSWRHRGMSFAWHAENAGAHVKSYLGDDETGAGFPLRCGHDPAILENLVEKMLQASPRPTAVFVPADSMTPYIYRALASRNIEVGKGLSVMSCNREQTYIEALHPHLTTLDIHAEAMGKRAVKQLASRLRSGDSLDVAVEIALEPTVVEGESVVDFE